MYWYYRNSFQDSKICRVNQCLDFYNQFTLIIRYNNIGILIWKFKQKTYIVCYLERKVMSVTKQSKYVQIKLTKTTVDSAALIVQTSQLHTTILPNNSWIYHKSPDYLVILLQIKKIYKIHPKSSDCGGLKVVSSTPLFATIWIETKIFDIISVQIIILFNV